VSYMRSAGHANTLSLTASTHQSSKITYETQQYRRRKQRQLAFNKFSHKNITFVPQLKNDTLQNINEYIPIDNCDTEELFCPHRGDSEFITISNCIPSKNLSDSSNLSSSSSVRSQSQDYCHNQMKRQNSTTISDEEMMNTTGEETQFSNSSNGTNYAEVQVEHCDRDLVNEKEFLGTSEQTCPIILRYSPSDKLGNTILDEKFKEPNNSINCSFSLRNQTDSNTNIKITNFPPIVSNPRLWSCEELAGWLKLAGYVDIAEKLYREEVDGASIILFDLSIFQQLGLKLGPAVKLNSLVEELKIVVDVMEHKTASFKS